jgi:anaerobic selenocysteine-containing dehydrogenase
MNAFTPTGHSACPHDCPSTCALDVELLPGGGVGRLYGAKDNSYTAGVICAKVARYAERLNNPARLKTALVRAGAKGEGKWKEASLAAALDLVAEKFDVAEAKYGAETVWPYFYAGTMGLVQRDGINRLRHAKRYSNHYDTICTNTAWTGWVMGTGTLAGADPREMAKADCVVIWGTNAAATQVNVMTHATRARKERGAKIVVVDVYENATARQADLALILRPGTDAALACAVMHVLFRDGYADRDYLNEFSDDPAGLESHLQSRTPQWAAAITGLKVEEIEAFARLVGETKKTFFRLGYGFTRNRNGAVSMHAAASIAVVTGAWKFEGGGAFHNNGAIFKGLDKSLLEGHADIDPSVRWLDQSRIGRALTGDAHELRGGPPVTALLIQNTNPANVAPEQRLVRQGLLRDDLFTCVHEQVMTETAELADVILPATMFLEHDDIYRGGGNQHIVLGPKQAEPPAGPVPNHFVIEELGRRLGVADRPGWGLSERQHIDHMLRRFGLTFDELAQKRWLDVQPDFEKAHFSGGFAHPDGKFRFRPDWTGTPAPNRPPASVGPFGDVARLPAFPDHADFIDESDADHPFRLATSPAHSFLNSSFTETPSSLERERRPELMVHPDDAAALGIEAGGRVEIGNGRGAVVLHARISGAVRPGVVVAEGIWPNKAHERGEGINVLVSADQAPPYGGIPFHDTKVWLKNAD